MKFNLIYYKCILDIALEKIISNYEDFFQKIDGKYVLGLNISKSQLTSIIEKCIDSSLADIIAKYDNKDVFVIIGSCYPKDNLLIDFRDNKYFPNKLLKLINSKPNLKWLMVENDIEIDIDLFNELFINVFNKKFKQQDAKKCNHKKSNIIFVTHNKLDCYAIFKTIKWAYGNINCCNVWKDKLFNQRANLIAINDLVSKYIHNKIQMNRSADLKKYAFEIKDYLNEKMNFN